MRRRRIAGRSGQVDLPRGGLVLVLIEEMGGARDRAGDDELGRGVGFGAASSNQPWIGGVVDAREAEVGEFDKRLAGGRKGGIRK